MKAKGGGKKGFKVNVKDRHPLRDKKAILFDANGVLYRREVTKLTALQSFLQERFAYQNLPNEYFCKEKLIELKISNNNKLSMDEYHDAILHIHEISDPSIFKEGKEFLEKTIEQTVVNDIIPYTLNSLKEKGYKIGVLTNSLSSSAHKRKWLEDIGIVLEWDLLVTSMDAQSLLPHPSVLKVCLEQLQVRSKECVYVGHSRHELERAKEADLLTCVVHRDDYDTFGDHDLGDELANILYLL